MNGRELVVTGCLFAAIPHNIILQCVIRLHAAAAAFHEPDGPVPCTLEPGGPDLHPCTLHPCTLHPCTLLLESDGPDLRDARVALIEDDPPARM